MNDRLRETLEAHDPDEARRVEALHAAAMLNPTTVDTLLRIAWRIEQYLKDGKL